MSNAGYSAGTWQKPKPGSIKHTEGATAKGLAAAKKQRQRDTKTYGTGNKFRDATGSFVGDRGLGGGDQYRETQRRQNADLSYARQLANRLMQKSTQRNPALEAYLKDPLTYTNKLRQQMFEGEATQINAAYQQGENQLLRGMAGRGAVSPQQREAALARMSMGKGEALGSARRDVDVRAALQRPQDMMNTQNIMSSQLQNQISGQQWMQTILGNTNYMPADYSTGDTGGMSSDMMTNFLKNIFAG